MSDTSSSNSSVTTFSGYASGDEDDDIVAIDTLTIDETGPPVPKAGPSAPLRIRQRTSEHGGNSLVVPGTKQALRKSCSDCMLRASTQQRYSTANFPWTMNRMRIGKKKPGSSAAKTSLHTSSYPLRRSSSHPNTQLQSRGHGPANDSSTSHQQLNIKAKRNGETSPQVWRLRRARTANGPLHWTNPASRRPGFKRYYVRSKSDPESVPQGSSKERKKNKPLKSSLKSKSKSAAVTPQSGATTPVECQQLRRVKTVDFEETTAKKLLPLPPLEPWSTDSSQESSYDGHRKDTRTNNGQSRKKQAASSVQACSSRATKSKAADCAVTRTDVHVVAVAPYQSSDDGHESGT
jgi:hypothetical protein